MSNTRQQSVLIDNIYLLTNEAGRPLEVSDRQGAILIAGTRIEAISQNPAEIASLRQQAVEVVDGKGKVAMPGLINSHCHTYATVLRGTENSQPLEVWALYTMAYGRSLDAGFIRTAVGLSAAEMIRSGVTSVIDHIPHIGLFPDTLDVHSKTGMRVGVAPFMQDIPDHQFLDIAMADDMRQPLETPAPMTAAQTRAFFDDFFARLQDLPDRLIGMIGPNAPQRCSPDLWQVWRDLRNTYDAPVHTHLLETKAQALQSRRNWPGGLVAEMQRQGLLNNQLSAAHCIWLLDAERHLLAEHDVTVVHNPASNLMLGSGLMPYEDYADRGIDIAIGSDSANTAGRHDIFEAIRLAAMLPRSGQADYEKWPAAADIMANSIKAGAKALGLDSALGQLAPGRLADLILLEMDSAIAIGPRLNAELIVQHASRHVVTDVMVDGNWLLRDGVLTVLNETELRSAYKEQRGAFLARCRDQSDLALKTAPVIRDYLLSSFFS